MAVQQGPDQWVELLQVTTSFYKIKLDRPSSSWSIANLLSSKQDLIWFEALRVHRIIVAKQRCQIIAVSPSSLSMTTKGLHMLRINYPPLACDFPAFSYHLLWYSKKHRVRSLSVMNMTLEGRTGPMNVIILKGPNQVSLQWTQHDTRKTWWQVRRGSIGLKIVQQSN